MSEFVRKNERVETHIVLSYMGEGDPGFNSSQLLDISRSGMQFTTSRCYLPRTRIEIHILVPTSYPNKLEIKGVVTHSHEKFKGFLYHTGVEFSGNTPQLEKEINRYLDFLGADKNISAGIEKKAPASREADKRRYKRLKSSVVIQYVELGGDRTGTSQIVDISRGGLLFNAEKPIAAGKPIRLKMTVPTSFPNPIKIEGTVKHCEEVMKGHLFQVGVSFSQEFPEPLQDIAKYIAMLEKKEQGPRA
jgi:hypothetical protein